MNYFNGMAPTGKYSSDKRTHRRKVGGDYSKGSVRVSVTVSEEVWEKLKERAEMYRSRSEFFRAIIEKFAENES